MNRSESFGTRNLNKLIICLVSLTGNILEPTLESAIEDTGTNNFENSSSHNIKVFDILHSNILNNDSISTVSVGDEYMEGESLSYKTKIYAH